MNYAYRPFVLSVLVGLAFSLAACSTGGGSTGSSGSSDNGSGSSGAAITVLRDLPDIKTELPASLSGSSASSTASLRPQQVEEFFDQPRVSAVEESDLVSVQSESWDRMRERAGLQEPYVTLLATLRSLAEDNALVEGEIVDVGEIEDPWGDMFDIPEDEQMAFDGGNLRVIETEQGFDVYWFIPFLNAHSKLTIIPSGDDWNIDMLASTVEENFVFGAYATFDTATEELTIVEKNSGSFQDEEGTLRTFSYGMVTSTFVDESGATNIASMQQFEDENMSDRWIVLGYGNDTIGGLAELNSWQGEQHIYLDFYNQSGSLIKQEFGWVATPETTADRFCHLPIEHPEGACDWLGDIDADAYGTPAKNTIDLSDVMGEGDVCDIANTYAGSEIPSFFIVTDWSQETPSRYLVCGDDIVASGSDYTVLDSTTLTPVDFEDDNWIWSAYYQGYGNASQWDVGDGELYVTTWLNAESVTFSASDTTLVYPSIDKFEMVNRVPTPLERFGSDYTVQSRFPLKSLLPLQGEQVLWRACWESSCSWPTYFLEAAAEGEAGYEQYNDYAYEDGEGNSYEKDFDLRSVQDEYYGTYDPSTDTFTEIVAPFVSTSLATPPAPFSAPPSIDTIQTALDALFSSLGDELRLSSYEDIFVDISGLAGFDGLTDDVYFVEDPRATEPGETDVSSTDVVVTEP